MNFRLLAGMAVDAESLVKHITWLEFDVKEDIADPKVSLDIMKDVISKILTKIKQVESTIK